MTKTQLAPPASVTLTAYVPDAHDPARVNGAHYLLLDIHDGIATLAYPGYMNPSDDGFFAEDPALKRPFKVAAKDCRGRSRVTFYSGTAAHMAWPWPEGFIGRLKQFFGNEAVDQEVERIKALGDSDDSRRAAWIGEMESLHAAGLLP